MQYNPANPLIVQGDRTILLEVDNPLYPEARDAIAPFAELEKSPEHIHTYRLTPLSLWNAAAAGMPADAMIEALERFSKFPLPSNVPADLRELVSRYGRVRLERIDGQLRLITQDRPLLEELARQRGVRDYLGERFDDTSFAIDDVNRGVLKQALISVGYPAEDLAGLHARCGPSDRDSRQTTRAGLAFRGPRLSGRGRRGLLRRRRCSRWFRRDRLALRRRQDDRRPGGDGVAQDRNPDPHHEHDGRRAVEAGDPRQDRPRSRRWSAHTPAIPKRWRRSRWRPTRS